MLTPIPLEYAPLPLGNARSVTVSFSGYHLFKSNFRQNVWNLHQALPYTRVSNTLNTLQHLIHSFFIDSPKKLFILFLDKRLLTAFYIITSFCGLLPLYHQRMASIVARIDVVLVNRELNDGSVNWPQVKISSNDFLPFMKWATSSYFRNL